MTTQVDYNFVLDCSVTMTWCFEDEESKLSEKILAQMASSKVIVPTIWPLEVANVLLLAQRKKRISSLQASSFIDALAALSITVDSTTSSRALHTILILAKEANLTIYDAAYLELALREKIPLASLDTALINAAKKLDIQLVS